MALFCVYQQIVTRQEKIKGITYDKTIAIVMRKVEAITPKRAIEKFTDETSNIKAFRRTRVGCVEFAKMKSIK